MSLKYEPSSERLGVPDVKPNEGGARIPLKRELYGAGSPPTPVKNNYFAEM